MSTVVCWTIAVMSAWGYIPDALYGWAPDWGGVRKCVTCSGAVPLRGNRLTTRVASTPRSDECAAFSYVFPRLRLFALTDDSVWTQRAVEPSVVIMTANFARDTASYSLD